MFKGKPGEPLVEETVGLDGDDYRSNSTCIYLRELCNLDVLGIENRGEADQLMYCVALRRT